MGNTVLSYTLLSNEEDHDGCVDGIEDVKQENYVELKRIGSGRFGSVYRCRRKDEPVRALKIQCDENDVLKDASEARNTLSLQHENVIRVWRYWTATVFQDLNIRMERFLFMEMEYCPQSLEQAMNSQSGGFTDSVAKVWLIIRALLNGLEYIHGKGLIHRDIKPDNILLTADLEPKIGDFGESTNTLRLVQRRNTTSTILTYGVGTELYMAPEMETQGEYTTAVDIYSLGVTSAEMMLAISDHNALLRMNNLSDIKEASTLRLQKYTKLHCFSKLANELIGAMIKNEPKDRAKIEDLLASGTRSPLIEGLQHCVPQREEDAIKAKKDGKYIECLQAWTDVLKLNGVFKAKDVMDACQPKEALATLPAASIQHYSRLANELLEEAMRMNNDVNILLDLHFLHWENRDCASKTSSAELEFELFTVENYLDKLEKIIFDSDDCPAEALRQARIYASHLTGLSERLEKLEWWLENANKFAKQQLTHSTERLEAEIKSLRLMSNGNYKDCVVEFQRRLRSDLESLVLDSTDLQPALQAVSGLFESLSNDSQFDSFEQIFDIIRLLQERLSEEQEKNELARILGACTKLLSQAIEYKWTTIRIACQQTADYVLDGHEPVENLLLNTKSTSNPELVLLEHCKLRILLTNQQLLTEKDPHEIFRILKQRWASDLCLQTLSSRIDNIPHFTDADYYLDRLYNAFQSVQINSDVLRQARIYTVHLANADYQRRHLEKWKQLFEEATNNETIRLDHDYQDALLSFKSRVAERVRFWSKLLESKWKIDEIEHRRIRETLEVFCEYARINKMPINEWNSALLNAHSILDYLNASALAKKCSYHLTKLRNDLEKTDRMFIENVCEVFAQQTLKCNIDEAAQTRLLETMQLKHLPDDLKVRYKKAAISFVDSLIEKEHSTDHLLKLFDYRWKAIRCHEDAMQSETENVMHIIRPQFCLQKFDQIRKDSDFRSEKVLRHARRYAAYLSSPKEHSKELSKWLSYTWERPTAAFKKQHTFLEWNIRFARLKANKNPMGCLHLCMEIIPCVNVLDDIDFSQVLDAVDDFMRWICLRMFSRDLWKDNCKIVMDILQFLEVTSHINIKNAAKVNILFKKAELLNEAETFRRIANGFGINPTIDLIRIWRFLFDFFNYSNVQKFKNIEFEHFDIAGVGERIELYEREKSQQNVKYADIFTISSSSAREESNPVKVLKQQKNEIRKPSPFDYELWDPISKRNTNSSSSDDKDPQLANLFLDILPTVLEFALSDCEAVLSEKEKVDFKFIKETERLTCDAVQLSSMKDNQRHSRATEIRQFMEKLIIHVQHERARESGDDSQILIQNAIQKFTGFPLKSCLTFRNKHYFVVANIWTKFHPDFENEEIGKALFLIIRFNWNLNSREYINYKIRYNGNLTIVLQAPDKITKTL